MSQEDKKYPEEKDREKGLPFDINKELLFGKGSG